MDNSALNMDNSATCISNSAIIMTAMVMIMTLSGNGVTVLGGWRDRIGCCGDGHGGLVTVGTGARVGRHESTYRTIRGHVTYDTRRQWWPAHGQWWSAHGQRRSARRRRGVVGERRKLARRRRGVMGERRGLALRRRGLMGEQRGLAAAERTNGDGGWDSRGGNEDSRDGDGQETAEPRTQQDA